MEDIIGYCMRCRKKGEMHGGALIVEKGRHRMAGECQCGSGMSVFVKKPSGAVKEVAVDIPTRKKGKGMKEDTMELLKDLIDIGGESYDIAEKGVKKISKKKGKGVEDILPEFIQENVSDEIEKRASKRKQRGGLVATIAAMTAGQLISEMVGDELKDVIKTVSQNSIEDLKLILSNPTASKIKHIYLVRLPRLGKRYEMLGNKIESLKNKPTLTPKIKANIIRTIKLKRKNIITLVNSLLAQIPELKKLSDERNKVLLDREAKAKEERIRELEFELDALQD